MSLNEQKGEKRNTKDIGDSCEGYNRIFSLKSIYSHSWDCLLFSRMSFYE